MISRISKYNKDEMWLYEEQYIYVKGFAMARGYSRTLKALPVARMVHDGQYRKGLTIVDGKEVRLPYITHPLKVCNTLISLNLPMSDNELDLLYAAALLHDTIEDGEFETDSSELMTVYGIDTDVYALIKLLSKKSGLSQEELDIYFGDIQVNKFANLIKVADRSHNVEDLYNMKNIPKYVKETRDFIYRMISYGKLAWPELSNGFTILKSKIVSLTESTEALCSIYEARIKELEDRLANK